MVVAAPLAEKRFCFRIKTKSLVHLCEHFSGLGHAKLLVRVICDWLLHVKLFYIDC